MVEPITIGSIAAVFVAGIVPVTVAIIKLVPNKSKSAGNGYVKQETFDVKHEALSGSVCRIGKDVTAMRAQVQQIGTDVAVLKSASGD